MKTLNRSNSSRFFISRFVSDAYTVSSAISGKSSLNYLHCTYLGNIFHGSMSLDQLYLTRPTTQGVSPGTPVPNLLICGSGAHPGGGVMGAPGRIAARDAVKKLGGKWEFS